jgi:hypothetical protein
VTDRLSCLRHHCIIGSDHDHGDIGNLGTSGTHGGKRFVTWCIEERNFFSF